MRLAWLNRLERVGNRLPDPVTLFVLAIALLILVSAVLAQQGTQVTHPGDDSRVAVLSLASPAVLYRLLMELPQVFAAFPPLALVLLMMVGVGVAERSGLVAAALGGLARSVPDRWLSPTVVFIGVMSSLAVDAGYVVVIPMAALLYQQAGRHPVAGIGAAFAGVSAGFSANLALTPFDALLAGLTQAAAQLVDSQYQVDITANYLLMVALVPAYVWVGAWLTDRVVEPRLGRFVAAAADSDLPATSRRGLWAALLVLVLWGLWLAWMGRPAGLLRGEDGGYEPLLKSLVVLLFLLFLVMGLVYGLVAGSIRSDRDVVAMMSAAMASMSAYIVLALFAALFLALFAWSNLGLVLAVRGAAWLQDWALGGLPLLLSLVLLTAFLNLFVGSASAKWAILAPVLVPMLMLTGISPEMTQAAYRIGDASTNPITPLLPYFPLILILLRKYQPAAGIGSLLALMLPYAAGFGLAALLLFAVWVGLGWPVGL